MTSQKVVYTALLTLYEIAHPDLVKDQPSNDRSKMEWFNWGGSTALQYDVTIYHLGFGLFRRRRVIVKRLACSVQI